MHRVLVPSLVLMMTACDPQNATLVVGDYTAWLAATNSLTVSRGDILKFDEEGNLEASLTDPESPDAYDNYFAIDCREFEAAEGDEKANESLRLNNRLKICEGEKNEDPDVGWPPTHEVWLDQNGYHVINDALEAWRGEAIITSEGDVQLTFHHGLPNGEDFRFSAVVDPNFQPRRCVENQQGELEYENVDGDWIEEWSKGTDGKNRYYFNAGAYQFNPENFSDANARQRWFLPLQWRAAHAEGRFGDDNFRVRSTRYAEPEVYVVEESAGLNGFIFNDRSLYWCSPGNTPVGTDPADNACMASKIDDVRETAIEVAQELSLVGIPDDDSLPSFQPLVEDNTWRPFDGFDSGLDAWVELSYSWISFDPGTVFEPGGAGSGEFNIFFDAVDSNSRFHVRGRFTVDSFAKDFWTTDYLPDLIAERNETVLCGEPAYTVE